MSDTELLLVVIGLLLTAAGGVFGVYKLRMANRIHRETAWADVMTELSVLHASFRGYASETEDIRVWLFRTYRLLPDDPKLSESLKTLERGIDITLRNKKLTQRTLDTLNDLINTNSDGTPSFKTIAKARRYARRATHLVGMINETIEKMGRVRQQFDELLED